VVFTVVQCHEFSVSFSVDANIWGTIQPYSTLTLHLLDLQYIRSWYGTF
jgi:hypothetical protein